MIDYRSLERTLVSTLQLDRRPVAVAFPDAPPAGVAKLEGTQPSGCSFWKMAAEGRTFYTVPADHLNCPVGSYTHSIPLPTEREPELERVLGVMTQVGYIRMEEVPGIPRLAATPGVILYAPLADTPVMPDVVLVAGRPGRLMLLQEAAMRGGAARQSLLGRPTCMAIPAAVAGGLASSLGCIGNRVYTDIGDDEFYTVIAGRDLAMIAEQMATITSANAALADYHRERLALRSE